MPSKLALGRHLHPIQSECAVVKLVVKEWNHRWLKKMNGEGITVEVVEA